MGYSLSKVQFLTLAALARHPMHIYAMRQEIIELTDNTYYPTGSTLTRAVKALQKAGYIEECRSNPYYWLKARRGVPYELTLVGRKRLDRETIMYFRACQIIKMWHRHGNVSLKM